MDILRNRTYLISILLLLSIDIVLIVLNVRHPHETHSENTPYDITKEYSYGGYFQYCKQLITVAAILTLSWSRKKKKYITWLLIPAFLLLEDIFHIHHYLGHFFYNAFGMTNGQQGLALMKAFAAVFLSFIVFVPCHEAYKRGDIVFKNHCLKALVLLLLFLFCDIVLNQAYQWAAVNNKLNYDNVVDILIHGGSMITASLLTGYMISIALKKIV